MCKYCNALMKTSNNTRGLTHNGSLYLERIGAATRLCSYEYNFIPIIINHCPWCGNNLNWAACNCSSDDTYGKYLVIGSLSDGPVYDAEYIIGSYSNIEDFEDSICHDYDMMRDHDNMWYYVIQPNVEAKYHQIVKIEKCDV